METSTSKKTLSSNQKSSLLAMVGVVILIGAFVIYGRVSYNKGYNSGKEAGKKEVSSTTSVLKNVSSPFQSVTGKIDTISNDQISLVTTKGDKKTVKLTKSTMVTKDGVQLKTSDLEKNQKVSVFTLGQGNEMVATRITVLK